MTTKKSRMYKKLWLLTVLTAVSILLFPCVVAGAYSEAAPQQEWSRTYGPYRGRAVIQTSDGGYAMAGENATYTYRGYTGELPCLIKTDSSGKLEWGKTYGQEDGASNGYAYSLVQTNDSGYALCGEGWLLKTDSHGNVQWNKTLNIGIQSESIQKIQVSLWSIIKTIEAGFVLTGLGHFENNSWFGYMAKTDENGNVIWDKIFTPQVGIVSTYQAVQSNDGNFAVSGNWNGKAWFVRTDSDGNIILNRTYEGDFISVVETQDGFVLAGSYGNSGYLYKVDSSGNTLWKQTYFQGLDVQAILFSVVQAPNRGFLVAGHIYTTREEHGYGWFARTDASGSLLWNLTFGGELDDEARSMAKTSDGGFVVAGTMNDSIWLAKFSLAQALTPTPSIPEFQSWTAIAAGMIVLSAIAIVYSKKSGKNQRQLVIVQ